MKKKAVVVESRDVERAYGFTGTEAIIDHPKHGRILIADGFGGMDSIEGGCVRWRHGTVIQLHPDDDFDALDALEWNESYSGIEIVYSYLDKTRPGLDWAGYMIDKLATSLGI